jgi:xanthine dehydrogenase accessory factor
MNENEYLAKTIKQQLDSGFPLVLVSIINLEGSTPRHDGTKMAVGSDGKAYGTIGGSLIEAAAIKKAKQILTSRKPEIMSFELDGKDAAAPGMICGGKAEIFLDYLAPSKDNKAFATGFDNAISLGKDFFTLTSYKTTGEVVQVTGRGIIDADLRLVPGSTITSDDAEKLKTELHNVSTITVLPLGDSRVIVDRIRKMKTLYCFGAGHVAVPTARLAALVGFRVVVFDDRTEYANKERFPEAVKTIILKDYNRAIDGLEIDKDSFIVIVTRGHKYDREVLEQAIKTSAGYVGMISSKRKRSAIYETLLAGGITQERLDFVHSPIGIDIGGETPEEIAVSVVAELIKVRSEQSV